MGRWQRHTRRKKKTNTTNDMKNKSYETNREGTTLTNSNTSDSQHNMKNDKTRSSNTNDTYHTTKNRWFQKAGTQEHSGTSGRNTGTPPGYRQETTRIPSSRETFRQRPHQAGSPRNQRDTTWTPGVQFRAKTMAAWQPLVLDIETPIWTLLGNNCKHLQVCLEASNCVFFIV